MHERCNKEPFACTPAAVSRQTAADGLVFRTPMVWKQSGGLYLNGTSTPRPQRWKLDSVTLTTWWSSRVSRPESQQPQFLCHRGCIFWALSLTRQQRLCPVLIPASLPSPPRSPLACSCSQALSMPCSTHCAHGGEGVKLHTVLVNENSFCASFFSLKASN